MTSSKNIKSLLDGKIIVVANDDETAVNCPLHCFLCEFPMKTMEDSIAFRKTGCCFYCEMRWGTPNKNLKSGWDIQNGRMPNKQSPEWQEYIQLKTLSAKTIFKLK